MSQNYDETFQRGTELFRLAAPLMLKQTATPNPISFAVWYEHVAGRNTALSQEIEVLSANGGRLTDQNTLDLYRRYLVDAYMAAATSVHDTLTRVMSEAATTIDKSRSTADDYSTELRQRQTALRGPIERVNLQKAVTEILNATEGVSMSMAEIGSRLAANRSEVDRLRDELRQAKELSLIDALSRLTNRRGFDLALDEMVGCARDSPQPLSLILVDIDHFKQFNDKYGHLLGDRVISGVARAMTLAVREADVVARYGGEEFAILLPKTGIEDAAKVAERIRASVARAYVRRVDDNVPVGGVTISAGVTTYRTPEPAADFVNRADKALFAAKFAGRNRVQLRVD